MIFPGIRNLFLSLACLIVVCLPGTAFADELEHFEPISLTVLQLQGNGVSPEHATTISELLAVELSRIPGLRITNSADLTRMMDLEAQKQTLGCDESSCLLEVAAAVGARYVVWGSVGKLGNLVVVTVNLFDSDAQRSVHREVGQAQGLENAPAMLGPFAKRLVSPILPEPVFASSPKRAPEPTPAVPTQPAAAPKQANKSVRRAETGSGGKNLAGWGALLLGTSSFALGYCGEIVGTALTAEGAEESSVIVPLSLIPLAGPPLVAAVAAEDQTDCSAGCLALSCQLAGCAGMIGGTTLLLWNNDDNDSRQAKAGVDASLYGWLPVPLESFQGGAENEASAKESRDGLHRAFDAMAF